MTPTTRLSLNDYWSLRYAAGGAPMTHGLSQRIGALLAWLATGANLSPSLVTLLGVLVFALGAVSYAVLPEGLVNMLIVLVLLQLGYGLDCADGQLARATGQTSAYGAWLDVACDYLRNIMLATAATYWLFAIDLVPIVAFLAPMLFLAGSAFQLHTITVLRRDSPTTRMNASGVRQLARRVITLSSDTALVLLVLALLRPIPVLLALYLSIIGLTYLLMAAYQAHMRLPAPTQATSSREGTSPQ